MAVETEVKIRWTAGADAARALMHQHGFQIRTPRQLEVDQVYDHSNLDLWRSGQLLRLRAAGGQWVLTYKGPRHEDPDGGSIYKVREEIETGIVDGVAFQLVLERLGYQPAFRYEKYRTIFSQSDSRTMNPGIVTLDETPIGDYMELEGSGFWIEETAQKLGFVEADYITASYAALYREYVKQHIDAPVNMTF